ncbi:hypothetical protein UNDKW_1636 [Undibacterium sp. KW1]|uniref:DUF2303 family protein n=1 Tax=Undibacterium sp. KW1 TaxID=2058624 RepID=UPI001331DEE8|nr:DUF2303 family protein [Undibacterium sp. KW1]BBB59909.1 hypothetical protein UNDKW_1636 [Undibacterium sp. KW1]
MNTPLDKIESNIAETLAREMKTPIEIGSNPDSNVRRIATPPGWNLKEFDDEKLLATPRRKQARVILDDKESFIDYIKRHGSLADSTIWCKANYKEGKVSFIAILNDHGEDEKQPAWRDHQAKFRPEFSEEYSRWISQNKQPMSQTDFAKFLEDNLKDIVSQDDVTLPTGAQMLNMALSFEANQENRFKSAIRLQNGGIQMTFVQDDDQQTIANMQMFERFAIGIPVFWNGDAYRIDARLRYRQRDGKLTFYYELIRSDKTLEAAAKTLIQELRDKTGNPFFFGDPFNNQ